jgi:calcineurin-like phosphoesterase family protein
MEYFIGDLHLDHTNIIKYCNRPFKSTEEMNTFILKKWNEAIDDTDTVYFLGDIAFGRGSRTSQWWWSKLKGCKVLIKGNHDRDLGGLKFYRYLIKEFHGVKFLLIHSPSYNDFGYKGWVIHGHHHNNYPNEYPLVHKQNKTINVSAEVLNYTPISLDKIMELIKL